MKFTYSIPTQLRTGIISSGPKKIYFIDLPRTKSEYDSGNAILSVIEEYYLKDLFLEISKCKPSFRKLAVHLPLIASSDDEYGEFTYSGKDISILDKYENRYPWQNEILSIFLTNEGFVDAPHNSDIGVKTK